MVRAAALILLCSCATVKPPAPGHSCQAAYDGCLNQCFASPNYKVNGPQCAKWETGQLCPQANQLVDTVQAGACIKRCDWDARLCR